MKPPVFRKTLSATKTGDHYDIHDDERGFTVRMSALQYEAARRLDGRPIQGDGELTAFVEELNRWGLLVADAFGERAKRASQAAAGFAEAASDWIDEFDAETRTVAAPQAMLEVLAGGGERARRGHTAIGTAVAGDRDGGGLRVYWSYSTFCVPAEVMTRMSEM